MYLHIRNTVCDKLLRNLLGNQLQCQSTEQSSFKWHTLSSKPLLPVPFLFLCSSAPNACSGLPPVQLAQLRASLSGVEACYGLKQKSASFRRSLLPNSCPQSTFISMEDDILYIFISCFKLSLAVTRLVRS